MGCPDNVAVGCPKCGLLEYFQSKGGPCECLDYNLEDAPEDVMSNVNRHSPYCCEDCGTWFYVDEDMKISKEWFGGKAEGINGFYSLDK